MSGVDAAATPGRRLVAPAVARAAAERGIPLADLDVLVGSGPGGRVRLGDLPATGAGRPVAGDPLPPGASALPRGADPLTVPLGTARLQRAREVVAAAASVAALTSAIEVDLTAMVLAAHPDGVGADEDVRLRLVVPLIAALAVTLADHPVLNARLDLAAGVVASRPAVDLAVVSTGRHGEFRRILPDVGARSRDELEAEVAALRLLARAGSSGVVDDVPPPSFTLIERPGASLLFETSPLAPGTAGTLALGKVERRPLDVGGGPLDRIGIRWAGYLCLTYDHRLVDGADAARFLADLAGALGRPYEG